MYSPTAWSRPECLEVVMKRGMTMTATVMTMMVVERSSRPLRHGVVPVRSVIMRPRRHLQSSRNWIRALTVMGTA